MATASKARWFFDRMGKARQNAVTHPYRSAANLDLEPAFGRFFLQQVGVERHNTALKTQPRRCDLVTPAYYCEFCCIVLGVNFFVAFTL
jgi:hypothetical protein